MTSASNLILASIPSPDRGVWELDLGFITLPLRAYALCIIAGIVVAIWWGERRLVARGGAAGTVIDVAVYAVPFGLVGGRLYHVATDYYRYFGEGKDPLNALRIWDGGLGIWGAIALGAVGAWIGCRRKGVPLPVFADAVAPGIVVAQAIGRVGNYFNQELYGGPTDLPWGLEIYRRINETTGLDDPLNGVAIDHTLIDNSPVHPTFLYELVWNLVVAALIVLADRKLRLGHGRVFALYVAGYTLGRGVIEMMRTDPATMVLGLRINVWTSIALFLGAIAYYVLAAKRGGREDLSAPAVAPAGPIDQDPGDESADSAKGTDSGADTDEPGAGDAAESTAAGDPEQAEGSAKESKAEVAGSAPAGTAASADADQTEDSAQVTGSAEPASAGASGADQTAGSAGGTAAAGSDQAAGSAKGAAPAKPNQSGDSAAKASDPNQAPVSGQPAESVASGNKDAD
ncbi:prolipoprotein diacylglyceryl transferase [Actinokineospora iranica]|uniref:Phosphatidylglycerol--prolipoprotein diacylglyceryl transferase n=1 Tax=Actinokineospora iranica TaxID=1271860 RepID=A0A1G6KBI6_9PSEU|nr:prolipoprotein diacylglyceryl transferase [Actinokineospora iranica]